MTPLKDKLSPELAEDLGKRISQIYPLFDRPLYEEKWRPTLLSLELKDRARLLASAIFSLLNQSDKKTKPLSHKKQFSILIAVVESYPIAGSSNFDEAWGMMIFNELIELYSDIAYDHCFPLAEAVTQRFSAEFGIRHLLLKHPEDCLERMLKWTSSDNFHLRRLASEGSRPRLPWGIALPILIKDPKKTAKILDALKDDPEEYIRRSVANHLNDHSRTHPDYVISIAKKWSKNCSDARTRLIKHACRNLLKSGNREALDLFRLSAFKLKLSALKVEKKQIVLGELLPFSFKIKSEENGPIALAIDYQVHLVASGGKSSLKVIKGPRLKLIAQESKLISTKIHLKAITTRRYYSGSTRVEISINGTSYGSFIFTLDCDS